MVCSAAGVLSATSLSGASESTAHPAWNKRHTVADASRLRVLQFTDVHFFNGINKFPPIEAQRRKKTLEDLPRLVDHAKPDLLLVTGDLWHDNPDNRGAEFMAYSVEQLTSLGVPWAFTWGNHDQLDDYPVGHKMFSEAKHSLYAGSEKDGNYVISLEDASGTALVQLFCLNTRNTGMHAEARSFVAEAAAVLDSAGPRPMRLGAFHIPVRQYEDVWEQKIAAGIIGETVCFEQEDRSSIPVLHEAGIQAVFCGHDHVNDYSGVMEGVDLIYGRATGHGGYGADKVAKGAKLYTLDPARKSMEWVSLLPDGTTWSPAPGERIEKW